MTDYTELKKLAYIRQTVKNALCIDGHLNDALDSIIASNSPDGIFCTLTALSHKAVDMSFYALLSHICELERRVAELQVAPIEANANMVKAGRQELFNICFPDNSSTGFTYDLPLNGMQLARIFNAMVKSIKEQG